MRALLFLIMVGLISFCACGEEEQPCTDALNPKCPNYDPCLSFQPANADFVIIDSIYGVDCNDGRGRLDLVSDVDTAVAGRFYFRALHEADSYEWNIGSDPTLYHDKTFSLYFPLSLAPSDINVSLKVCKEDPNDCQSRICDTLNKKIHILFSNGYDTVSFVTGKFIGVDIDFPLDTFTIDIPPPLPTLAGIINFPKGCIGQFLVVQRSRKGILIEQTPTICQSACGVGKIMDDRKTLVIDYSIQSGDQRIIKKFIGTKIN